MSLNYEVKSGLAWFYVPLAIALGLWISYQVKVKLQTTIELGEARVKAGTLIAKVQADLSRYKDKKFHDDLADAYKELNDAHRTDEITTIGTATTALDAKWREALQHFDERNKQAEQVLNDIDSITANPWSVPAPLSKVIDHARVEAVKVRETLNAKDATKALADAGHLQSNFGATLKTLMVDWQQRMSSTFRELANARSGIPAPVAAQFKQEIERNPPDLNRINPASATMPVAAQLAMLNDASSEYSGA